MEGALQMPPDVRAKMEMLAEEGERLFPSFDGGEDDREAIENWLAERSGGGDQRRVAFVDEDGTEWYLNPFVLPKKLDEAARIASVDEVLSEPWLFWSSTPPAKCDGPLLQRESTLGKEVLILFHHSRFFEPTTGKREVSEKRSFEDRAVTCSTASMFLTLAEVVDRASKEAERYHNEGFLVTWQGWPRGVQPEHGQSHFAREVDLSQTIGEHTHRKTPTTAAIRTTKARLFATGLPEKSRRR